MGEIIRTRGVRYTIEDTTNENKRKPEHIHFYDNDDNRYRAFIDRENRTFIFNSEEIPRRLLEQ